MADPVAATIRTMLLARGADATLCPSEVARALAKAAGTADWRAAMPRVHDAVDALAAAGQVRLSWRGRTLPARDGPYRIGRAAA